MSDEWGPWIEHGGRGCPLAAGAPVYVACADGVQEDGTACGHSYSGWHWEYVALMGRPGLRVLRYRIRKPRGMVVLESLLVDLPEQVDA